MSETESVTLTTCDREPIHLPGTIQPHGIMLVLDEAGTRVEHVAGEAEGLFPGGEWRGAALEAAIGPELAARAAELARSREGTSYVGPFRSPGGTLDIGVFRTGRHVVVELEPASEHGLHAGAVLDLVEEAASAFERAPTVQALCERAATIFRRLTGFDRVMVYHFLDDGAGRVLAEARREGLHAFLNHHFPAADIPRQARALYLRNLTRVIPDARYAPAPLRPAPLPPSQGGAEPLDMSDSGLRSVSPIHLQYLRNMGVTASASISVVRDGALWGLIACHNETPRLMPYDIRAACRSLAGGLARQIRAKEDADNYRQRIRLRGFEDDLARALGQETVGDTALSGYLHDLARMFDADGVALVRGEALSTEGVLPSRGEVRDLAAWATAQPGDPVLAISNLEESYPAAYLFRENASGLLSIALPDPGDALLLFRAERVEVVNWAGHPHKAIPADPNATLTPRSSFEAWQETVRGRARRWTIPEIEAAGRLHALLGELRRGRRLKELNRQLSDTLREREELIGQKDFLMGEVNHRVQNSLQLVASFLALQGRTSTSPEITAALNEAQRRVSAVSLVHRRLYSGEPVKVIDAARYIEELCADAIGTMGRDWAQHLSMSLAPVQLPTDRAVTLGLVLTELLININKYAYGGAAGPIRVELTEGPDSFRLVVADRGKGRPEKAEAAPGRGFGSRMIAAMLAQLRGTLAYENTAPGLRATLTVPLEAPSPRG